MDYKEMREKLREVVETVPRSNEDMVQLFNEKFPDNIQEEKPVVTAVKNDNIYTYIGAGHEPPAVINFMGLQSFIRGKPVTVTNPKVLNKIKSHTCFVKGEVEAEVLTEQDQAEDKRVKEQRKRDEELQLIASKNRL